MFKLIMLKRPTWKFDAINAVNGGPNITQHANAVEKSIEESINSLYLLDKLLNIGNNAFINQFYFKKRFVCILLTL